VAGDRVTRLLRLWRRTPEQDWAPGGVVAPVVHPPVQSRPTGLEAAAHAVDVAVAYAELAARNAARADMLADALHRAQAAARRQYDRAEHLAAQLRDQEWRTLPTLGGAR
jgi:hypothetical protein